MVFVSERGVALVHRVRAEHIARTLLGDPDVLVLDGTVALPTRTSIRVVRRPPLQPLLPVIEPGRSRWRDIVGWLGIVAVLRC